jgi:hypothetical protein
VGIADSLGWNEHGALLSPDVRVVVEVAAQRENGEEGETGWGMHRMN